MLLALKKLVVAWPTIPDNKSYSEALKNANQVVAFFNKLDFE